MVCFKYKYLQGCSKCNILLSNSIDISKLKSVSITPIVEQIFEHCISYPDRKLVLEESSITCNGILTLSYIEDQSAKFSKINKEICREFIKQWYKLNKAIFYEVVSFVYAFKCLNILDCKDSDKNLLKQADELNDLMTNLVMKQF